MKACSTQDGGTSTHSPTSPVTGDGLGRGQITPRRRAALTAAVITVRRRLAVEQLGVGTPRARKLGVGAGFGERAVLRTKMRREADCAEAVADEHGHFTFG